MTFFFSVYLMQTMKSVQILQITSTSHIVQIAQLMIRKHINSAIKDTWMFHEHEQDPHQYQGQWLEPVAHWTEGGDSPGYQQCTRIGWTGGRGRWCPGRGCWFVWWLTSGACPGPGPVWSVYRKVLSLCLRLSVCSAALIKHVQERYSLTNDYIKKKFVC